MVAISLLWYFPTEQLPTGKPQLICGETTRLQKKWIHGVNPRNLTLASSSLDHRTQSTHSVPANYEDLQIVRSCKQVSESRTEATSREHLSSTCKPVTVVNFWRWICGPCFVTEFVPTRSLKICSQWPHFKPTSEIWDFLFLFLDWTLLLFHDWVLASGRTAQHRKSAVKTNNNNEMPFLFGRLISAARPENARLSSFAETSQLGVWLFAGCCHDSN